MWLISSIKRKCYNYYFKKQEEKMKQIIVLAAFIALGIFISSIVIGFEGDVKTIGDKTNSAMNKLVTNMDKSFGE
jgi:hypothetical protein